MNNELVYTTFKEIIVRLYRNKLMENLDEQQIASYTMQFCRLMGSPFILDDTVIELPIINHIAPLPKGTFAVSRVYEINPDKPDKRDFKVDMSAEQDDQALFDYPQIGITRRDIEYKVDNNRIIFNVEKGHVRVYVSMLRLDDEGFPVIPNDENFLSALENYIKVQYYTILADIDGYNGGIQNALNRAKQEYAWYAGKAQNSLAQLSPEKADMIARTMFTLIPARGTVRGRGAVDGTFDTYGQALNSAPSWGANGNSAGNIFEYNIKH